MINNEGINSFLVNIMNLELLILKRQETALPLETMGQCGKIGNDKWYVSWSDCPFWFNECFPS